MYKHPQQCSLSDSSLQILQAHQTLLLMREKKEQAKLIHVDMTGQTAEEEGMVCGGVVDILLEIV